MWSLLQDPNDLFTGILVTNVKTEGINPHSHQNNNNNNNNNNNIHPFNIDLAFGLNSAYNGILVPVRTSFGLRWRGGKTTYQRKVDVDMLNAVKSVLADVSSVSPSSEQPPRRRRPKLVLTLWTSIPLFLQCFMF